MSAEYTPCKVCLVEGYLGAGKTTLLNNGHRIAVIVNDIGEINIDARLIEKSGGGVTMQDGDLIPLTNGCICCTLSEDLAQQLSDLACSNKYDYIVIEASGICEPMPIAQTITMMSEATKRQGMPEIVHVDNIVAVVDAARLKDEFSCGEVLREVPEDEEDLASLLIQQIEFCDTIMLNKCDLVTEEELQQIEAVLRALQTRAKIIRCEYGDVPMEEVLDTDRFNYEEVAMSAGWIQAIENDDEDHDEHHDEHEHHHHDHDHEDHDHEEGHGHGHHHHHHHHGEGELYEYNIQTFVFEDRKPFDMDKLQRVFMEWPVNTGRTSGHHPARRHLAGRRHRARPSGSLRGVPGPRQGLGRRLRRSCEPSRHHRPEARRSRDEESPRRRHRQRLSAVKRIFKGPRKRSFFVAAGLSTLKLAGEQKRVPQRRLGERVALGRHSRGSAWQVARRPLSAEPDRKALPHPS